MSNHVPTCPRCGHTHNVVGYAPRVFYCTAHPCPLLSLDEVEIDLAALRAAIPGAWQAIRERCGGSELMLEYPGLEWGLFFTARDLYRAVVLTYPHTSVIPSQYTVSSYISRHALGYLLHAEELAHCWGPATGAFDYNPRISYWAPAGADPNGPRLTWVGQAHRGDLDAAFPYARIILGLD